MKKNKINLKEKYSKFSKYWSPRIITEMNDYQFKIAKIKGEFVWHDHKDTDETFIVIEGEMDMKFCLRIIENNYYLQFQHISKDEGFVSLQEGHSQFSLFLFDNKLFS